MEQIKKIALAYSGGLDTSVMIHWLKNRYNAEVIAICTDVGQGGDFSGLRQRAISSGADKFICTDITEKLLADFLLPAAMSGAKYDGRYMLGTSAARSLQAKVQTEIAIQENCDALAHGGTGKGNDQVRFEVVYKAFAPGLKVIVPWRLWDLKSREDEIEYAHRYNIDLGNITADKIYSRDRNIWNQTHEGGRLEDISYAPDADVYTWTESPESAPGKGERIEIGFESGVPVSVNNIQYGLKELVLLLNETGARHGIGREDILENRLVGIKNHGIYETPGGTILYKALEELRMLVLDRDALRFMNHLGTIFADMIYDGKYFTHIREVVENAIRELVKYATGTVAFMLYKGNITVAGRKSPYSLYEQKISSFCMDETIGQNDAEGFINLYSLPVRLQVKKHGK